MDEQLLPAVRDTVKRLSENGRERPKRITVSAVTKEMGLPEKRFEKLPRCREEIRKRQETQEEYWARETVWAYRKLVEEGTAVNWKQIRSLTNMRKEDFLRCQPYLPESAGKETVEMLKGLV